MRNYRGPLFIGDWIRVEDFWYNTETEKSTFKLPEEVCAIIDDNEKIGEALILPKGWRSIFSNKYRRTYFWNDITLESSNIKPKVACSTVDITDISNLPTDWEEKFDELTNKFYYVNSIKDEIIWSWPGFLEKYKQKRSEINTKIAQSRQTYYLG